MRANNTPNDGRHPMMSRASEEPEWVDDKPAPRYGRWVRLVAELQKHPGRWAVAERCDTSARARTVGRHLITYGVQCEVQKQDDESGWVVFARARVMS